MNASTGVITTKSPYIVRLSFSTWQSSYPLGNWAAKHGIKTVYTLVSDYAPGIDYETGFAKGLTEAGGTIVGAVRMPVRRYSISCRICNVRKTPNPTPSLVSFRTRRKRRH